MTAFGSASQQTTQPVALDHRCEGLPLLGVQHRVDVEQRIEYGFRLCTARPPNAVERGELLNCYRQLEEILRQDPEAATGIMPRRGEEPGAIDAAEFLGPWSDEAFVARLDPLEHLGPDDYVRRRMVSIEMPDRTRARNDMQMGAA